MILMRHKPISERAADALRNRKGEPALTGPPTRTPLDRWEVVDTQSGKILGTILELDYPQAFVCVNVNRRPLGPFGLGDIYTETIARLPAGEQSRALAFRLIVLEWSGPNISQAERKSKWYRRSRFIGSICASLARCIRACLWPTP